MRPGEKLPLEFNGFGQAIGINANIFTSHLGKIVRNGEDAPITYKRWEEIPQEKREKMYKHALVMWINIT